jgi:Co/Zn/Cd efflux system component
MSCGDHCDNVFEGKDKLFKRALLAVTVINMAMFFVEMIAGHVAQSRALQADALDFLGDSLTYAVSFIVIGMSARIRAGAALGKGISLMLMGLWVLGSTIYQLFVREVPQAELMGSIAFLAFAANLISVLLLAKWRNGDANVRSVWLCSRNDAIGNMIVIIAAAGVFGTGTAWPDLIVAIIMAGLFLTSSTQILRQGIKEWRANI